MIAIMQRVTYAKLFVNDAHICDINKGVIILVGVHREDSQEDVNKLAAKIVKTRIFHDEFGKINKNVIETENEVLLVSNFTLQADLSHGNRPNFSYSANKEIALPLFDALADQLQLLGVKTVKKGVFGEHMIIDCQMKGPINLIFDSKEL